LIAVDSSVWISAFNDPSGDAPGVGSFRELIAQNADIAAPVPVYTEVLKGARDDAHAEILRRKLAPFPVLSLQEMEDFVQAALLFRLLRMEGHTIRSNVDLLIAAICIREDAILLHADVDFDRLAEHTPLRVWK
jgi:predicted nucleic acid-binding protein